MFEAPRISMQSAHECSKIVSPTHRPHLPPPPPPPEISLLFISVSPYSRGTLSYVWATTLGEGRGLHNNELEITNREWLRMPEPDFYREDLELV